MSVSYSVLREQLERERDRIVAELQQLTVSGNENLGYSTHMADDASAAFDQARDLALRDNMERTLKEIKAALNRFADGTYGQCASCGQTIDPARLKVLPQALYCLDCKRRMEH